MRLRTRIIIAVVIASSIINLFLCFYFTEKLKESEFKNLYTRIEKSAYMMKLVNARPLYNVDKETLRVNMETFFDDENIKSISLHEHDIDIDIKLERKFGVFKSIDIKKSFYIYYKSLKLGKMNVVYSTSLIEQKIVKFRNRMLFFAFTVIVFLAVVLIFLVNKLMQPVTKLSRAASEVASGNLDKNIEQSGVGEVGELSRNFAAMRDAVKDKINDLAMTNRNLEKEIFLKEINEKKILRQSTVISSVNHFFQQSMLAETYEEISQVFIPIALKVIPSKYCFVGEVRKDKKDSMEIMAISDQAMHDCNMIEMDKTLRLKGLEIRGSRSLFIKGDTTIILNDPKSHPDFIQPPENHIPIDSFLGVPMKLGSEIKGVIAFAGKEGGYDFDDQEACEILAVALVEALSLKKREDEKAKLEEMMIQSEKMISIGSLAAGMAHEINNPLAGILQNAQVIQNRLKKKLPANVSVASELGLDLDDIQAYMEKRDIYKMINSVMDAGKRAAAIVANMLSFSRKSTSGFMPENAHELLDKTLELAESDYNLKDKFDFKKIKIIKKYAPGIPKISCKASEIQQVFLNVLSNGAQAMMSRVEIHEACFKLKISREENMVKVEIKDNGPGMKSDTKKRIFEPFFTTKTVGDGTGLGLAVSYFIITENHKGSIDVHSKPSKGTNFIIKLPVAEG
ncbi:MAG: HAMP domain-containing protein [Desulfobacula sp.]|uniref:HAMP domain-containing sensor histidine kinase n=1 Tax=Desulfobacula sp. TaxID=2593537 RepID=UPI0025BA3397|nr:ATP-binding protein [Desulfobacula sp.]MCD4721501.1 HAMP domain-containing protein [Desulfobacula sp.]